MASNNSNGGVKIEPDSDKTSSIGKAEITIESNVPDEERKSGNREDYIDDHVKTASSSKPEIKTDRNVPDEEGKNGNRDEYFKIEIKTDGNVPDKDGKNGDDYIDDHNEVISTSGSEIQIETKVAGRKEENADENNSIIDLCEVASCGTSKITTEKDAPVKKTRRLDEGNESSDFSLKNMVESYRETYEAFVNEITALSTIPILKSISEESIRNFAPYNLKYYDDKYCIDFGVKETRYCDINVRIHTNKLFLIALASGNDIIRSQKNISEINFVINNIDKSNIKLRGKKKAGSKKIDPRTILCQVKYQGDNKMYNIRAGVSGSIIEINELIKKNPNLMRTDPKGLGFIAVILPKGKPYEYDRNVSKFNLLSQEEYFQHLLERTPKCE